MKPGHPLHCVCIAGVVVDDGRVLLVRRSDNLEWEPPGGALERGEGILEAVSREIREETGIEVETGPLIGVYQNRSHAVVTLTFRCSFVEGRPRASAETAEVRWVPLEEADGMLNADYQTWLADAQENMRVEVRAQTQTFIGT